jgi:hypothetical protein
MSMATKDTRPAAMADSGPHSGPALARRSPRPPASPPATLPRYGPADGHGRSQALPDLIAVTRAERAGSRRDDTG